MSSHIYIVSMEIALPLVPVTAVSILDYLWLLITTYAYRPKLVFYCSFCHVLENKVQYWYVSTHHLSTPQEIQNGRNKTNQGTFQRPSVPLKTLKDQKLQTQGY